MSRLLLSLVSAATLGLCSMLAADGDVKVERMEYRGWKECWRLSNGTVELVFVPAIGRIMRYARVGGPNVLWENPNMLGKLPVQTKDWQNFGGDKVWPAPQTAWGWPPDPEIDPGRHEASGSPNGTLVVKGSASEKSGVRFEREIRMDSTGTSVRILNRMINTSPRPLKWAVWEIAQIDDPDVAEIPRSPADVHAVGYHPFADHMPNPANITVGKDHVTVRRDRSKSAKIGSYSRRSMASTVKNGQRFTISVEGSAAPSSNYPHGGGRQEIYTNPDPDGYVEMELLGPVRELRPGASLELRVRWSLTPLKKR